MTKGTHTPVIFRRFNSDPRVVVALFPTIAGDNDPDTMQSYMHVGQHGVASESIIAATTPVDLNDPDVVDLWRELIERGYTDLRPYKRMVRKWREVRRKEVA